MRAKILPPPVRGACQANEEVGWAGRWKKHVQNYTTTTTALRRRRESHRRHPSQDGRQTRHPQALLCTSGKLCGSCGTDHICNRRNRSTPYGTLNCTPSVNGPTTRQLSPTGAQEREFVDDAGFWPRLTTGPAGISRDTQPGKIKADKHCCPDAGSACHASRGNELRKGCIHLVRLSPSGLGGSQFEPRSEEPIGKLANLRCRAVSGGSGGARNNFNVCSPSSEDGLK